MSHLPQRKENKCLNCGTEVIGRYCHVCGQENLEPKESFWHLITHFFYDFTHFDGKFFSTLRYLIIKPGFVSSEYIKGRRASYLHPIRMYVFTSAFFFIIFFWIFTIGKIDLSQPHLQGKDSVAWLNARQLALQNADNHEDSMEIMDVINKVKAGMRIDSARQPSKGGVRFTDDDTAHYSSIAEYDSVQKSLPEKDRDSWLRKKIRKREIVLTEQYRGDRNAFWRDILKNFIHQFPKLFFISLPIFAFILKLLYIRRRNFYYADHTIFSIHLYIFSFILFLVLIAIMNLHEVIDTQIWNWISLFLWLYWLYYIFRAMRNFYKQGLLKTIVKYIILSFLAFFTILILFGAFFTYSVLET